MRGSGVRILFAHQLFFDERIEILVAVEQCQSLLDAAGRDQRIDGFFKPRCRAIAKF